MARKLRRRSLASISTMALCAAAASFPAGAAKAQEGASPLQPEEAARPIDEIIVTARKREETLQDTSMALSVVDDTLLERKQINDVTGLQGVVPTVTIGETVGLLKINVRGLGNSTNTRSEDSDVVLHVDGAVVSRMEAQAMAFFDLERVEVLRGPQGTLYGRNSTGGTINLVTKKPTDFLEGYASATLGNYNLIKMDAAVSGPITDTIDARLALTSTNRGGFGKNIQTDNDIEDQKRYAGRLHVRFRPSDRIELLVTGEYAKQDDASGFFGFLAPLFPFDPTFVPRGAGGFSDPDSRDVASNFDPQLERETWSLTGNLGIELNDNLKLRNIINYRELDFFIAQDLDTSTVSTPTYVSIPLHDEQFSEELQLVYESDRLNAIAGMFYFKETFGGTTNIGTGPNTGVYFVLNGRSKTEAIAPFFNVSYDLSDAFTLRVGGRYNSEKRSIVNDTVLNGNRITTDNDISDDERRISAYTGEYGIDWNISDNAMVYYTFSQGFRSGAALIFQSNSPIIDPTKVKNHEIGLKFESPDRRFYANVAAFTADIKNLQRTQASLVNGLLNTRVNNVNSLETKGVEVDLGWSPVENLNLRGSAAWLKAEFQDFVTDDPIIPGTMEQQVAGNTTSQAPEWKWSAGADYTIPFANGSRLTVSGDVSYQSKVFFDEFNRAPFVEDDYALVDASMTYYFANDKLSASIWGKNLTGQDRFADVSFSAFGQVLSKQWIPPRTYGATVRYEF
jgi:iron complex outermembrane receptor protein